MPKALIRVWHFLLALWGQYRGDKVVIRASGLAYVSLLALVPLVAVLIAIFSAFGALDDLRLRFEEFLVSQFLPTRQDEIATYLNEFVDNAKELGFLGFAFLTITAILLLNSIESNFNDIWHVRKRRHIVSKVTAYTSVLVLGPLSLGTSLSVSARLKALIFSGTLLDRSFVRKTMDYSVPLALTLLGFLLLYLIVPNIRVRWRSAALGALVAGVGWELAKNGFANWMGQSVRYSTLYGSLATIPIFLVWLYVTWVIVLIGLEVAFTHQHFAVLERDLQLRDGEQEDRASLALKVFALIAQRFHTGEPPPSLDEVAERFLVPLEEAERTVGSLVEAGLARTAAIDSGGEGLVPATSLEHVKAIDVLRPFQPSPGDGIEPQRAIELAVASLMGQIQTATREALAERSFKEIVEGLGARPEQPSATDAAQE
jgi:membrane protein